MKQATLHISFDTDDLDLFNKINEISSSKHINKSGLVRFLIRKSLNDYEQLQKDRTETSVSLPTL
jgi:hypothetical protein